MDTVEITLPRGKVLIVDADIAPLLTGNLKISDRGVVMDGVRLKDIVLGRSDAAVKYQDGNPLNCTRENLSVVRAPETHHKERIKGVKSSRLGVAPSYAGSGKKHSEVVGVTFRKDRAASKPWRVRVQVNGTPHYLGHYATREEAEAVALEAYSSVYES